MSTVKQFEDLEIWMLARSYCQKVFIQTNQQAFARDFRLKDQINRSSGSIMDNIAEGFDRMGVREFIHFLTVAKGSCAESRSQLYRAFDRQYINAETLEELVSLSQSISRKTGAFIQYLLRSNNPGGKFRKQEQP